MPRYLIERTLPGDGRPGPDELAHIATSCRTVAASLGVPYVWVSSMVAGGRLYCVHEAEDLDAVHEHVRRSGAPADRISEILHELVTGDGS